MDRYLRQLALPELTAAAQKKLPGTRLLMVGAGGLGAAALPYLAGAGIGHITIIDHDNVDISNLHRQTIFKTADAGKNKAECAAQYLRALNPDCNVKAINKKLCHPERSEGSHKFLQSLALLQDDIDTFDLLLDGSDNFATKYLLNEISIETQTPLISASVEQFKATIGFFAGHLENAPCYACLFPRAPVNACNCNDAGILGTVAGLAGLYQAHLALCYLLNIGQTRPGTILSVDLKDFRLQNLHLAADPADAVLVAGLAGALAPDLAAGDLVLYDRCLDARNERELAPGRDEIASIVMDDALPDILAALFHTAGQRVRVAPGITVGEVLVTAQAKLAFGARHRAAAVDMETFEIAVACREQGIPFAALRVVSDEAGQDLPDFNRAYDAAGRVLPAQMAAALLARPAVTARFLRQLRPVMRSFRNALTVALDAPLV